VIVQRRYRVIRQRTTIRLADAGTPAAASHLETIPMSTTSTCHEDLLDRASAKVKPSRRAFAEASAQGSAQ